MRLKIYWLISFILTAIIFIPIKFSTSTTITAPNEAIIHAQSCGCPCPDATVIKGQFIVPDSLKEKFKTNEFFEIYLTGADPFANFEIYQRDIKIKGEIIGAKPDFCDNNGCYFVPIVRIDSWILSEYVPWFWNWNPYFGITYLLCTLISFLISIALTVAKIIEKFKKKN